jgi:anthranilate synthase component 2
MTAASLGAGAEGLLADRPRRRPTEAGVQLQTEWQAIGSAAARRLFLLDNYDSFTFNLYHRLGELGAEVKVVRNDTLTPTEALALGLDAVVVSPGPCDPDRAGISLGLIEAAAAVCPVLGVCLGHQAIGQAYGGTVVRAPVPMHGKISLIHHDDTGLFAGLPNPFPATRYHSLIVDRNSLPAALHVNAWTEDGLIMGLRHESLPVHGVQFHPESIETKAGHALLRNFLDLVPERGAA